MKIDLSCKIIIEFTIVVIIVLILVFINSGTRAVNITSVYPPEQATSHVEKIKKDTATEILPHIIEPVEPSDCVVEDPEIVTKNVEDSETIEKYYDVPISEDLQSYIFSLCEESGIDPTIIISMIKAESNFDSSAIGDNGNSKGLMQIQSRWHQNRMDRLGCTDLLDPYQNVTVGVDLLSELIDKGNGVEWALMAYNGGIKYANDNAASGTVSKYVSKVMDYVKIISKE